MHKDFAKRNKAPLITIWNFIFHIASKCENGSEVFKIRNPNLFLHTEFIYLNRDFINICHIRFRLFYVDFEGWQFLLLLSKRNLFYRFLNKSKQFLCNYYIFDIFDISPFHSPCHWVSTHLSSELYKYCPSYSNQKQWQNRRSS